MEKKYNSIQEETVDGINQLFPILKRSNEGQAMTILIQSYAYAKNIPFKQAQKQLALNIAALYPEAADLYMNERVED